MSAPASECGSGLLLFEDLLRAATGKDSDGNPILRLTNVTDAGDFNTCANQGTPFNPAALFGLNEEGKIALRVNISNLT